MTYFIQYTLTVEFSIQDYTRQLHNNKLLNIKSTNNNFYHKNTQKLNQKVTPWQNTLCLEQKNYAIFEILHQRCW